MSKKILPFYWYGGKFSHLKWLLPIVESIPHITYVEPCGGSAAVLLNKSASKVEVYNDIYAEVVNFFTILRTKTKELIREIKLTPYSRHEFSKACSQTSSDDLERARLFFVRARQVRAGLASNASPSQWTYSIADSSLGMSTSNSRWLGALKELYRTAQRLKRVQIENLDILDIIKRYDTTDTLFLIDPPYLLEKRTGGRAYLFEFDTKKHEEMLKLLLTIKGKVVLCGYDNELYNTMLVGWRKKSINVTTSSVPKGRQKRIEIIWHNTGLDL
jgi:DNA adenine methylase